MKFRSPSEEKRYRLLNKLSGLGGLPLEGIGYTCGLATIQRAANRGWIKVEIALTPMGACELAAMHAEISARPSNLGRKRLKRGEAA